MGQGKKDEAMALKEQVSKDAARLAELEEQEKELQGKITKIMMTIPNIIDPSVPIGKDDSCNVEIEKFGEPVVPDFEIPYHTEIMERFDGIDLDAAGKVAGNGFYYLMGDIARVHSAVISYARDFMIDRGFTYCVPPFMIRSNVVTGVMSFAEMDAMMYKIEGEDLYLIGTSEHSMIGKFIDTINDEEKLPYTLTSYSPCFRKEKGAHGIEERGVYRIHQFEKQEMIVVCKPEDSKMWFDKLWKNTVDLFRSMDIPVRTIECCSGDLADLKVKSYDVEAWSPRQKKYFEVGSCSNLGDAQARRLGIKVKGKDGKYFAHTLNNTRDDNQINCYDTGTAPCKTACPAHVPVQGYVKMAAQGRYMDALKLIKTENPFPAVCGSICNRRCEDACTRGTIDQAVAIDEIKKFIAEQELHAEKRYIPPMLNYSGKPFEEKVAVIGAGPAGMSAAFYLKKMGYPVTVFEKEKRPGGMLMNGIPSFRLEKDVINAEIGAARDGGRIQVRRRSWRGHHHSTAA